MLHVQALTHRDINVCVQIRDKKDKHVGFEPRVCFLKCATKAEELHSKPLNLFRKSAAFLWWFSAVCNVTLIMIWTSCSNSSNVWRWVLWSRQRMCGWFQRGNFGVFESEWSISIRLCLVYITFSDSCSVVHVCWDKRSVLMWVMLRIFDTFSTMKTYYYLDPLQPVSTKLSLQFHGISVTEDVACFILTRHIFEWRIIFFHLPMIKDVVL